MKVIDVVFGKRMNGSFYHVNTQYLRRHELDEANNNVLSIVESSIADILAKEQLDDEVQVILNKIRSGVSELASDGGSENSLKLVNNAFSILSYLEYELWFIVRNDLSELTEVVEEDRSYVMNKEITANTYFGISNIQVGLSVLLPESTANINSMIMEFIHNDLIKITSSEEDAGFIGLDQIEYEYSLLHAHNESVMMDTSKLLRMMENKGYTFILSLNPISVE